MIFKCTLKVRKSRKLRDQDLSMSVGDGNDEFNTWYCNSFHFDRRKCLIWTHGTTLFTVLAPGVRQDDLRRFGELFRVRAREILAVEGISQADIDRLLDHQPDRFAKTDNRSVLGCMNDHVFTCRCHAYDDGYDGTDFNALNHILNHIPMGGPKYKYPLETLKLLLESPTTTTRKAGVGGESRA